MNEPSPHLRRPLNRQVPVTQGPFGTLVLVSYDGYIPLSMVYLLDVARSSVPTYRTTDWCCSECFVVNLQTSSAAES